MTAVERPLRVLFVCSRNQWRSPTAERVFASRDGMQVRSRGLSQSARRKLRGDDVDWADVIFVMEDAHRERLVEHHRRDLGSTPVHVLDIPDEYRFMDPELVEMLRVAVDGILSRGF